MDALKFLRLAAAWAALAGSIAGLAGCNTVAGFGQDMSEAGHAIRKAAE